VKATAGSAEQTLEAHLAPGRAKCASARALTTEQLGGKDGATVKQSAATRPSDSDAMVKAAGVGRALGQEVTVPACGSSNRRVRATTADVRAIESAPHRVL
jgi:hypothetical protein